MDARTIFLRAAGLHQAGEFNQAVVLYQQVLGMEPMLGEAALYLGMALQQLGRSSEAVQAYTRAVALLPDDPDPLNNLGTVHLELGNTDAAREAHLAALKLLPTSPDGLSGLANVFSSQGRHEQAVGLFRKALDITPGSPDVLNNLGVSLKAAGNAGEAIKVLERALRHSDHPAEVLYNLGNAWQMYGDMAQARHCHQAALEIDPANVSARWGGCFAHLETSYDTQEEIDDARKRYAAALEQLDQFLTLDSLEQVREAAAMVGANQPFYLTYQGKNDRALQDRYGRLVHRVMTTAYPNYAVPKVTARTRDKIRVGIATGFMHEHSVWKIPTRGWVQHLDRDRFEVFGYSTGVKDDHCTHEARQWFDSLVVEPYRFEQLCERILADDLDVLVYPDIGMDPTCAKLAGLRLAPVQAVSVGHPMTTGLPTMDYYLSSDLMEPEDGDEAYTEQLVRLPNLGVHYAPLRQGEPLYDRAHFGLPEDRLLYFSPQSLYKYLPAYDALFPRIAREVPACRFVFLQSDDTRALNSRFRDRLERCFAAHSLDMDDFVTFLPYQAPDAYHALNCLCDVFLDSIGWSGFNTAMEAANAGLPVITWPREYMRGRHSLAVVERLGTLEAIASSFDEYVQLAVRMGTDAPFRARLREAILENRSRLFHDQETVRGLEAFLERVARQAK